MTSSVQREAVKNALAKPLAEAARIGMAFRILWRHNEEMIWRQILTHRGGCDQFLKNLGGISFMVSAITGMAAKSPNPAIMKVANPGVSYWLVLESPEVDPRAIVRSVQGALQGQAEVKLLQEPPLITSLETIHSTLCTAMKDHSNTYIKRRISESQPEIGIATESKLATRLVVVKPTNLDNQLTYRAKDILQSVGIFVDIC